VSFLTSYVIYHAQAGSKPFTGTGISRTIYFSILVPHVILAAAVVPMKDDGTVILIRQFRHAAGGFIYEIPAGKLHPGEDPRVCAARELEEEVGYRSGSFELLSSIFTAPGFTDEVIHIYKATGLTAGQQQLDRDEVLEVIEMPLTEAIRMIETGVIRDAKSIVGLQAVYLRNSIR
jgi:ADP-ribose pyrophosphatase